MSDEIPDHVEPVEREGSYDSMQVQAHLPEFPSMLVVFESHDQVTINAMLAAFKRGGFETRVVELQKSFRLIRQSDGYAK